MSIKNQSPLEKVIFGGIIALLVFAPLAFGSVHVWAYSVIQFGVFLLLGLWVVDRLILSKEDMVVWVKTPLNLLMIALLGLILFQTLPLPPWLVELLSPRVHADRLSLWQVLADLPEAAHAQKGWMPLTYYMHPTFLELVKLASYFGMFFLVLNTVKSKRQIDILIYVLLFLGLFEAIYAIYQVFAENPKVWWWQSRFGKDQRASGTFIGANHFAAYMGMIVCLAFGFLIAQKGRTHHMLSGLGGFRATYQRLVSLFAPESAQPKIVLFLFVTVIMGVSILLSGSRGSIISLGGALFATAVLFSTRRKFRKYGIFAVALCLLIVGYGFQIGIDHTLERFEQTQGLHERLEITRTIFPMMLDYPVLGLGWGNFKYLYPRYIVAEDQVSSSGYAHNDWVEAGIEVGFLGVIVIVAALLIFLFKSIRIWHRRRNLHALGIGVGVLAGLISISFHSYFDFNMHIPANPLTLAGLLGIGYAALYRQGHGYSESFFYRKRKLQLSRPIRITVAALLIAGMGALFHVTWRHAAAEAACPTEWNSTMNLNWEPELADIDKAIERNPINAEYHFQRALCLVRKKTDHKADLQNRSEAAIQSLRQAVALNPAKADYWYALGRRYAMNRPNFYDVVTIWLPLADKCYDQAVFCAPKNESILFNVADYWVWRSQLLPKKDMPVLRDSQQLFQADGIQKFQNLFQRYLTLNPGRWKAVLDSIWDIYPQDRVAFGIVPAENEELKSLVLQEIAKRAERSKGPEVRDQRSEIGGQKIRRADNTPVNSEL